MTGYPRCLHQRRPEGATPFGRLAALAFPVFLWFLGHMPAQGSIQGFIKRRLCYGSRDQRYYLSLSAPAIISVETLEPFA